MVLEPANAAVGTASTSAKWIRRLLAGGLPLAISAAAVATSIIVEDGFPPSDRSDPGDLVGVVVASALASMMLIETIKRLIPLRARFQRTHLTRLIGAVDKGTPPPDKPLKADTRSTMGAPAMMLAGLEQMDLRHGPEPQIDSPYNLPPEQLMAQLSAEVEIALERAISNPWPDPQSSAAVGGRADITQDQVRSVRASISVALDDIQIRLTLRWRHYLHVTSWWVSGWLALLASQLTSVDVSAFQATVVALAVGGLIAWVARDLTAAVESWRH